MPSGCIREYAEDLKEGANAEVLQTLPLAGQEDHFEIACHDTTV